MARIGAHIENFGRVYQELLAADGKINNDDSMNHHTGEGIGDVAKLTSALLQDAHSYSTPFEGYAVVSQEAVSFLKGEKVLNPDAFEDGAFDAVMQYAEQMFGFE
jgi:hypothetical protein